MSACYRWVIEKDHIDVDGIKSRVGTEGPSNADASLNTNAKKWAAYDDDGECYYEGTIYGDYDGFEPLDDFCTPDAGAVKIKLNGRWCK